MGHIVAADDDPNMRAVVERTLTRAGHTVDMCEDGRQLVAEVKATHPDAVVTDNEMPVMTGLGAAMIRRWWPMSMPLIARLNDQKPI